MKISVAHSALRISAVIALTLSTFAGSAAQPTASSTGPATPVLASDSAAVRAEILAAWRDYDIPVNERNETPYGPFDLRSTLKAATPEQLMDASKARTFDDVVAALPRNAGSGVVTRALAVGQRMPLVLGSTAGDLVFTPVTPCRIMDTRFQTVPARIGPDAGVQRVTISSDYSGQGGVATSCGLPASVSAVSINITSTNQSSTGSLRVIPSGAGNPPTAIMNYSPIQNIANAAVVGTNTGSTGGIFVYSASAAADVIIDVMGYFAPPVATPLDIVQAASAINNCATGGSCSMTASCPAGYVATGGGPQVSSFSSGVFWVYSAFSSNTTWLCQAVNTNASSLNLSCHATCARVPGI